MNQLAFQTLCQWIVSVQQQTNSSFSVFKAIWEKVLTCFITTLWGTFCNFIGYHQLFNLRSESSEAKKFSDLAKKKNPEVFLQA